MSSKYVLIEPRIFKLIFVREVRLGRPGSAISKLTVVFV